MIGTSQQLTRDDAYAVYKRRGTNKHITYCSRIRDMKLGAMYGHGAVNDYY